MTDVKLEEISDKEMEEVDRDLRRMINRVVRGISDITPGEDYYGTGCSDILGKTDLMRQNERREVYYFE